MSMRGVGTTVLVRAVLVALLVLAISCVATLYASGLSDFVKALHLEKIGTVEPSVSSLSLIYNRTKVVVSIGSAGLYVSQVGIAPIFLWNNATHIEASFLINSTFLNGLVQEHLLGFATLYDFPLPHGGFMYQLLYRIPAYINVTWINHTFDIAKFLYTESQYRKSILYPLDINITPILLSGRYLALRVVVWNRETGQVLQEKTIQLLYNGQPIQVQDKDWLLPLLIPVQVEQAQGYTIIKLGLALILPYKVSSIVNYPSTIVVPNLLLVQYSGSRKIEGCGFSPIIFHGSVKVYLSKINFTYKSIGMKGYVPLSITAILHIHLSESHSTPAFSYWVNGYEVLYDSKITKLISLSLTYYTETETSTYVGAIVSTFYDYVKFSGEWNAYCNGRSVQSNSCHLDKYVALNFTFTNSKLLFFTINRTTLPLRLNITIENYTLYLDKACCFDSSTCCIRSKTLLNTRLENSTIINVTINKLLPSNLKYYKIFLIGQVDELGGVPITIAVYRLPKFVIDNVTVSRSWIYPTNSSLTTINVTVSNVGGLSGTAKVCICNVASCICKQVTLSAGSRASLLFTVSGAWVSGGSEGNYTLSIYVNNLDTGTLDDSKSIVLHVYYPLFKICDLTYNGTSIYASGVIDGVWGGSTVTVNVKVCNLRTGGSLFLTVRHGNYTLYKSNTYYVPLGSCITVPVRFRVHTVYAWRRYVVEIHDVEDGKVDDSYVLEVRPGAPKYEIVNASLSSTVLRPYDNATLYVTVRNIGKSISNFTLLLLWNGTLVKSWRLASTTFGGGYNMYVLRFRVPDIGKHLALHGNFTVVIVDPLGRKVAKNVTAIIAWTLFKFLRVPEHLTVLNGTEVRVCVLVRALGAYGIAVVRLLLGAEPIGNASSLVPTNGTALLCINFTAPRNVGNYTLTWVLYDPYRGLVEDTARTLLTVRLCPLFKILNVTPSTVRASPGATFTVTVCVTNLGAYGTGTVGLEYINGTVVDSTQVSLGTGQVACVDLSGTVPMQEGTCRRYIIATIAHVGSRDYIDDMYSLDACTFVYVPNITIVNVKYPRDAKPGTSITFTFTLKNVGNGTGKVIASPLPPRGASCRCVKCSLVLPPEYSGNIVINCTTPLGPGTYLYNFTFMEVYTRDVFSRALTVTVAKPPQPIQLSMVLLAIGGLATFGVIALALSALAKAHEKASEKKKKSKSRKKTAGKRTSRTGKRGRTRRLMF